MKTLLLKGMTTVLAMTIGARLTLFGISEGRAQEKRKISYKWSAANTKYTQQHVIDVGDVPGHQLRIYEIHRTWPSNPPALDGVRVKEEWFRGYSDYTDVNGHTSGYTQYRLENGDRIFARLDGTSQTIVNPDGSKKSTIAAVITLTQGTGRSRGIRGVARYTAIFDPKAGVNEGQVEGEYWIEK